MLYDYWHCSYCIIASNGQIKQHDMKYLITYQMTFYFNLHCLIVNTIVMFVYLIAN